ncbi:hypothetical protein [Actinomadura sp. 9N215]|uniref:hypothetical protein n=1 Tax=Actinomadura sp. 9N215 TaxID=3375150 RepID=UPI00379A8211
MQREPPTAGMTLLGEHSRPFTVEFFHFFVIGANLGRVLATDLVVQSRVKGAGDPGVTINYGNYFDLFAL